MSLDGVPLIAVLNTPSRFHFSLTRFSITVIINILKEAAQNTVFFAIWQNSKGLGALFLSLYTNRTTNGSVRPHNSIPTQNLHKIFAA